MVSAPALQIGGAWRESSHCDFAQPCQDPLSAARGMPTASQQISRPGAPPKAIAGSHARVGNFCCQTRETPTLLDRENRGRASGVVGKVQNQKVSLASVSRRRGRGKISAGIVPAGPPRLLAESDMSKIRNRQPALRRTIRSQGHRAASPPVFKAPAWPPASTTKNASQAADRTTREAATRAYRRNVDRRGKSPALIRRR